jgi:DNA-binding transcriptional ArsR family regulator
MRATTRQARRPRQRLAKADQIRVLASPIRQEILDTVDALGRCTIAQVGAALGRPPDGLYYHVRALQRARLLTVSEAVRRKDGRSEARLEIRTRQTIEYRLGEGNHRDAVLDLVAAMLRNAERQFGRAYRPGAAVVSGPRRNLWAARARGFVTAKSLARVNTLLRELLGLFHQDAAPSTNRANLHEITFILAPPGASKRRPPSRGK